MSMAAIAPVPWSSVSAPQFKARVISDFNEFLDLESAWSDLVDRARVTHPFLEHCWIRSWWECFGAGSRAHIIVVRAGGSIVAIAPLNVTTTSVYGVPARKLGFFYNAHVPRAGFIVDPQFPGAYETIWQEITRFDGWDLVQLCQLTEAGETLPELLARAQAQALPHGTWISGASPRVRLNGVWDEFHQTLPAKHRSNLRNRYKRFDQLGPSELDTVTGGARLESCLEEGLRLEAAAWKGAAGTAILAESSVSRFYRVFAERAAQRGWLRLNFLRSAGRAAAFDYSLEYRERVFLLKLGYDPEFSAYSPSNLLLGAMLKRSFEHGLIEYDFLGEEAEWKRCWTTDVQTNCWLSIFSPGLKGRLLHGLKFRIVPRVKASPLLHRLSSRLVRQRGKSIA